MSTASDKQISYIKDLITQLPATEDIDVFLVADIAPDYGAMTSRDASQVINLLKDTVRDTFANHWWRAWFRHPELMALLGMQKTLAYCETVGGSRVAQRHFLALAREKGTDEAQAVQDLIKQEPTEPKSESELSGAEFFEKIICDEAHGWEDVLRRVPTTVNQYGDKKSKVFYATTDEGREIEGWLYIMNPKSEYPQYELRFTLDGGWYHTLVLRAIKHFRPDINWQRTKEIRHFAIVYNMLANAKGES